MKPETTLTVAEAVQGGLGLLLKNEATGRQVLLTFISDSHDVFVDKIDRKSKTQSLTMVPLESICLAINIEWVESNE